jgi:uncharacterized protein (DUF1697 family)
MPVVVSMLRSVNLAKHNRVRMDALKVLYASLGFEEPRTFIQSGNVVFRTREKNLERVRERIESGIEREFGFRTPVILRTTAELREALAKNPFARRPGLEPNKLLFTFLASDPGEEAREAVRRLPCEPEELHIEGRELYIYYTNGMARPKVSLAAIEKRLKVPGTGRNWNSVRKLLEIAEQLE